MKRSAFLFATVWCFLSVICAFVMFHFAIIENTKISQFILLDALFMVGLGVFFTVYRDKIDILLGNYNNEN